MGLCDTSFTAHLIAIVYLDMIHRMYQLGISQPRLVQLIAYMVPFVYHGCSLLHCICIIVQIIGHFTHLGLGLDTSFSQHFYAFVFLHVLGVAWTKRRVLEFARKRITKNRTTTTLTGVFVILGATIRKRMMSRMEMEEGSGTRTSRVEVIISKYSKRIQKSISTSLAVTFVLWYGHVCFANCILGDSPARSMDDDLWGSRILTTKPTAE